MLPHYSPYKVAENFKLLEVMYPGRLDLGVGRAPGSDQYTAAALGYGSTVGAQYFPNMVKDLQALLKDESPPTPGMEKARAFPLIDTLPELWMLGSSEDSAHLAAQMGLPYSFAYFINSAPGATVFEAYRRRFQAQQVDAKPRTNLGVFVICADTEEEALHLAKSRELWYVLFVSNPKGATIPSPEEAIAYPYTRQQLAQLHANPRHMIVGAPEQVKTQLEELATQCGADELTIVTITYDFAARCRSYELLSEVW